MIETNHLFIALILVVALPVVTEFVITLVKVSSNSPVANPVAFANSQSIKMYLSGILKGRKTCGLGPYLFSSILFAGNLLALAFATSVFEPAEKAQSAEASYTFFLAYVVLALLLRVFIYVSDAKRINYAKLLENLSYSFIFFILISASLALSKRASSIELVDWIILIFAQAAIFLSFLKLFNREGKTFFERHVDVACRLSLNLLLLGLMTGLSGLPMKREYFFLAIGASMCFEVFMNMLEFESLKIYSNLLGSLEKYFVVALAGALTIKVLL